SDVDVAATTFTNKLERLKLQIIQGQPSPDLMTSIAEDVSMLPPFVLQDPAHAASARLVLSTDLATATPSALTEVISDFAPEMRNKRRAESAFVTIDLPDFIAGKSYVMVGPSRQPVHVDEYRRRVEQRVLQATEANPALQAIRAGSQPTEEQLVQLERVLHNELLAGDIALSGKIARQAF